ncbi:MAG: ABC transporter permease [Limnochordaceae bacterium]|nr:ABC transporter permease [Limnochordaceae bacterium]
MRTAELLREAWHSVKSGGMRSFLSALGIVIGVAAVITLVSVGEGARLRITAQLTELGSNLVTVSPAFRVGSGGRVSAEATQDLTVDVAASLRENVPAVADVTPIVQTRATVVAGASNLNVSVMGVDAYYDSILNYHPLVGRFIQERDGQARSMAVVLGYQVATQLFGSEVPVGLPVMLVFGGRSVPGVVVGVMEPRGSAFFSNFDNQVYVPIESMVARGIVRDRVGQYLARVRDGVSVEEGIAQIEFFFARKLGGDGLVNVTSQQAILSAVNQATGTMTLLLSAIAGVALVVGGIGIMNVMLVAVAERTREIGVRLAIGARRRDIARQFLAESGALSLIGGVVGLLVGWFGAWVLAGALSFPFVVSVQSVIVAIGFSTAVGMIFGLYPAQRASRLDPVEALRYE